MNLATCRRRGVSTSKRCDLSVPTCAVSTLSFVPVCARGRCAQPCRATITSSTIHLMRALKSAATRTNSRGNKALESLPRQRKRKTVSSATRPATSIFWACCVVQELEGRLSRCCAALQSSPAQAAKRYLRVVCRRSKTVRFTSLWPHCTRCKATMPAQGSGPTYLLMPCSARRLLR